MKLHKKNIGFFLAASLCLAWLSPAHAALITNPDDARSWQGATVGTFAQAVYGSNTAANRQQVVDDQLLDDGTFNTSGVGFGSYYGNNLGCSGYSYADGTYGYSCGSEPLSTYTSRANDLDWEWIQDTGNGGSSWTQGNVWDLGGGANSVAVFPIVDHGPLPGEAWEYSVYLSNNKYATSLGTNGATDWVAADLVRVYLEGWDSTQVADGFTTVWQLPTAEEFRYVNVFAGGPGAYLKDGDDELDAVAGFHIDGTPSNPVPEPGTMILFGSGLLGLGFLGAKRNKK